MPLCMPVWTWRWSYLERREGGREGGKDVFKFYKLFVNAPVYASVDLAVVLP